VFGQLKRDADGLAADAAWLQRERNAHARRGYAMLKRRIGSPAGLVACFGAGVFAGARSRRRTPDEDGGNDPRSRNGSQRREGGLARRVLQGPAGAVALRLGTAWLAGALMRPEPPEGAGQDPFP
jgi:hypothetical protein